METGTKVKLTARAVKARSRGYLNRKVRSDWAARTGVVHHKSNRGRVSVVWEGNKYPDHLQLVEVERCDE